MTTVRTSKKGKNNWYTVTMSDGSYWELLMYLYSNRNKLCQATTKIYGDLLQGFYESSAFQEEYSDEYDEHLESGDHTVDFWQQKAIALLDGMVKTSV